MNVSTEKKIIGLENRLVSAWGEREGVGRDRELGVNRCKLLLLEWIYNEIPLFNTENYVLILISQHKNGRKKYVYMYV